MDAPPTNLGLGRNFEIQRPDYFELPNEAWKSDHTRTHIQTLGGGTKPYTSLRSVNYASLRLLSLRFVTGTSKGACCSRAQR